MRPYNRKILGSTKPHPDCVDNYVGVEIEFRTSYPREVIGYELSKYYFSDRVSIGTDGSIITNSQRPYGLEVRVCDTEKNITNTIRNVLKVLKKFDCEVNHSCGLHVHLDMRHRSPAKAYSKLYNAYNDLKKKVAKYRIGNENCRMNTYKEFSRERNELWGADSFGIFNRLHRPSKYRYINTLAYKQKKTLECRLHEGTLNVRKINNWIKSLVKVINE